MTIEFEQTKKPDTLYVRLNQLNALEVIDLISTPDQIDLPVVRAIVDEKLGYAVLPKALPGDLKEASILAFQRPNSDFRRIHEVLPRTPGVLGVSESFAALAAI